MFTDAEIVSIGRVFGSQIQAPGRGARLIAAVAEKCEAHVAGLDADRLAVVREEVDGPVPDLLEAAIAAKE